LVRTNVIKAQCLRSSHFAGKHGGRERQTDDVARIVTIAGCIGHRDIGWGSIPFKGFDLSEATQIAGAIRERGLYCVRPLGQAVEVDSEGFFYGNGDPRST